MSAKVFGLGVLAVTVAFCARTATADDLPPQGTVRFIAGGNSHLDKQNVLSWSFRSARALGAQGFIFLGDMELSPSQDGDFASKLGELGPVSFLPVIGNHELKNFGVLALGQEGKNEAAYQRLFLGTSHTAQTSVFTDKTVYSTELAGGVHLVALDNVSQRGFGADQLAWLEADLAKARANPGTKHIFVALHEPLARNGVTTHGMDEDGPVAIADSDKALALLQRYGVELILQAHLHEFASYQQGGIPAYVSGGLGSPLPDLGVARAYNPAAEPLHHFLEIDVTDAGVNVKRVDFPIAPCSSSADAPVAAPPAKGERIKTDLASIGHHLFRGFLAGGRAFGPLGAIVGTVGAFFDEFHRVWQAGQSSLPPDAQLDGPMGNDRACPTSPGLVKTLELAR